MKAYHYLMRLGRLFNAIAFYSERPAKIAKDTGVRGLIRFIRETIAYPWMDYEWLTQRLTADTFMEETQNPIGNERK